jgi:hypothetical protein|tara:strand:- start:52 stop:738 length:687 start_codon:yes stop_codon:yes gene_type:complete
MKKILLIVLFITGVCFAQTKWRQSYLDTLDGLVYSPTSEKPYTGKVFDLYENGAKKIEGSYKAGRPNGKWSYYSVDGELIRQFNYSKSNNLKNYLLGEWRLQSEIYDGDTTYYNENANFHVIVKYLPDRIIVRIKTSVYEFLEDDRWYQWSISDVEYIGQNIYKSKNRIFFNKDFIDFAKEKEFYESLLIQAFTEFEVNITGLNSFTETSISNKVVNSSFSGKYYRVN